VRSYWTVMVYLDGRWAMESAYDTARAAYDHARSLDAAGIFARVEREYV